jgi:hypothetical protein
MQGNKKQNLKKVEEETAAIAASAWKQALAQQAKKQVT